MNKKVNILMVVVVLLSTSCTSMKQRTMTIEESRQGAVITIKTTRQSYFDPDGFSRKYQPHVTMWRKLGARNTRCQINLPDQNNELRMPMVSGIID
jgi:hypothetical protein